jgi:hypothetical protein
VGVRVPPSPPRPGAEASPGWERRLETALEIGAAVVLASIVLLDWVHIFHARPLADDYSVAVLGKELGPAGYANQIWMEKSGRWTGHALLALVLANVDLTRAYPWTLAALALVSLGATYCFLRILFAESASPRRTLLASLAFAALLWSGRPVPGQTLYWFSGAVPYQLSLSCSVLLVSGLVACSRRERSGVGWTVLAVAMPVFVAGLQELVAMMLAVALAAGAWIAQRLRVPARRLWWWSLAAAIAGLAASLSAPGNAARGETYPHGGELLLTLRTLSWDCQHAVRDWLLEPRILAASLFLWLSPGFRALRPRWLERGARWTPPVALASVAALGIGLAGPRWATGTWQPPRMLAADYVVFFHAWFVLLFLASRGSLGLRGPEPVRRLARAAALSATALALVLTGNGRKGFADLAHGRLQRWSTSMSERYELIRDTARAGPADLVLSRPPDPPSLFARMDLSDDPGHWKNGCAARYFGLRSVALAKPEAKRDEGPAESTR